MRKIGGALAAAVLVIVAGCLGADEQGATTQAAPAADAQRVDPATAGTVTGRVMFEGTPPENPPVKLAGDPRCVEANADGLRFENYVVSDGGLDNVFVHVKGGLGNYSFETPTEPAKLDQQGCRYVPHVLGVRVGQSIEITNSDATTHNVHALPDANREINFAQFQQGQKNLQTFTTAEVMVPVKCDLHSWMNAWIGVVEHPFFAVTANGGAFELTGLPPGTYTIEAWHERAGTQTQQVTIGPGESKDVGFTFQAEAGQ